MRTDSQLTTKIWILPWKIQKITFSKDVFNAAVSVKVFAKHLHFMVIKMFRTTFKEDQKIE